MSRKLDVATLGQVFTPDDIVATMLALRRNHGRVLEPSAGDGAFSRHLPGCVAIEMDARVAPKGAKVMDFFAYSPRTRFDTVIGNPPYVRHQDIAPETRARLDSQLFDARSNLFLFFIEKSVRLLRDGGELIFITPREFIKLTAAARLNDWLFEQGTITHWIETGDTRIFDGAVPNCAIFRFVRGDFSRRTLYRRITDADWDEREMVHIDGQLAFTHAHLTVPLAELFDVRVGAVSGADDLFEHRDGNLEFVCSRTAATGETRRMLYDLRHPSLNKHKKRLLARRVRHFDESNWWKWGRAYHDASGPRIYVNGKTRRARPFFTHACTAYDGSILALFPKVEIDIARAIELLNDAVPWEELGFVVDGRYLFTQRTLATLRLPAVFAELLGAAPAATPQSEQDQVARDGAAAIIATS
ncbi:class I SAM-dependent methyltransferase [Pseudothauera nasutitermitis]|uniref:site-specific DNA-methyltransferase (adenine-specific) n=1 Tax=Pseudothauera nasutitermitis TaxID=2565930 RepID=A0A4S4B497_9RHOO|nr:class I SAM-dependent methyltransferase [Pseudothauera nasutitermitis]THF67111.1 class I SAM-dependent methyltransferase [Pseudothauera nasutitermitis]